MFNCLKKLFCRNNENKVTLNINTNSSPENINIEYALPDSSKPLNIEINLDACQNPPTQTYSTDIDNSSAKVDETTVSTDSPASSDKKEGSKSQNESSTSIFNLDQPIEKSSQDVLDRANLAKMIADDFLKFNEASSLAVGIYAKWGSGKTSFLNMILENIKTQQKHDSNIVIVEFKPWLCSDPKQLIKQFFFLLKNKIGYDDKLEIWKVIDRYSHFLNAVPSTIDFTVSAFAPFLLSYTGNQSIGNAVKPIMDAVIKEAKYHTQEKDLQTTKQDLIEALRESKLKIFVTIDDIDRLSADEIISVFQLVKSIADFPNTVYILAFDRDIVSNVLSKVQSCNGWDYLEKIIQVPFSLPAPTKETIHNILLNKLKTIILDFDKANDLFSTIYTCCEKYIFTIRDVNRYINVFRLQYDEYKELLVPNDLIVLTFLQVFEPNLYVQLGEHKKELIPNLYTNTSQDTNFIDKFARDSTKATKLINLIFNNIRSLSSYHNIANSKTFDQYFSLLKRDNKYSYNSIGTILYAQEDARIISEIDILNKSGVFIYFLLDIGRYLRNNPINLNPPVDIFKHIFILIARSIHKFTIEHYFFISETYKSFWKCIKYLLDRCNSEQDYADFMLSLFKDEQVTPVPLAHLYYECCFRKVDENVTYYSDKVKPVLQPIFIDKSIKAIESGDVLTYNDLFFIEFILEKFADYRLQVKSLLSNLTQSDDFALAKIISLNLGDGENSDYGYYWFLSYSVLEIDRELAYSRINNFLHSDQFNKLEGSFQEKAIAYLMICERINATPPEDEEKLNADSPEDVVKVYLYEVHQRMQELEILQQDKAD